MAKPIRKHKPSRKHAKPQDKKASATNPRIKHLLILITIFILAAIPFSLGKYFEFNSPGAFDSGAYVYSAKHILDGAKIGVDEKPSAQTGTLMINMLGVRLCGFSETGPKLIQGILQAGALLLMFVAMLKLFGVLPAAVGVIITSVYLSAPLIAKYGNVKEQYMIAFMILGISCFVLRQLEDKWWYALLAGLFLCWAPLFKETGNSAIAAVGLFVIAQPLLKHRTWKKTGTDILLLLAGAVITLAPIFLWLGIQKAPRNYFPYYSFWGPLATKLQAPQDTPEQPIVEPNSVANQSSVQNKPERQGFLMKLMPAYVRDSWQILSPEQRKQAKLRVLRWYRLLILPITLALGSIIFRILRMAPGKLKKTKINRQRSYDRFVLLFAVWWILDMSFVWISPRSYEQYYLPLNASAAMLGGYLTAIYCDKVKSTIHKPHWIMAGVLGFFVMIIMSWHIFFGVSKSAHSGIIYRDPITGKPEKQNGYEQKLNEVSVRRKQNKRGQWEIVSEYIKNNSTPSDGIYVWGWWPGIYVQAQRLSPAPKAFEGTMHTLSPKVLSERVDEILNAFKKKPPKFIVDSRKSHFPWDRPPLELWPQAPKGFLPVNEQVISEYDKMYAEMLRKQIEPDEALRYEAMKPFREYVMNNYTIAEPAQYVRTANGRLVHRMFGQQVLFQRK